MTGSEKHNSPEAELIQSNEKIMNRSFNLNACSSILFTLQSKPLGSDGFGSALQTMRPQSDGGVVLQSAGEPFVNLACRPS
jgi:hypothetical protein